jgi:hypothetical protein
MEKVQKPSNSVCLQNLYLATNFSSGSTIVGGGGQHRQQGDIISVFYLFSQNKKRRLKYFENTALSSFWPLWNTQLTADVVMA